MRDQYVGVSAGRMGHPPQRSSPTARGSPAAIPRPGFFCLAGRNSPPVSTFLRPAVGNDRSSVTRPRPRPRSESREARSPQRRASLFSAPGRSPILYPSRIKRRRGHDDEVPRLFGFALSNAPLARDSIGLSPRTHATLLLFPDAGTLRLIDSASGAMPRGQALTPRRR
jgi:hypothetical protein